MRACPTTRRALRWAGVLAGGALWVAACSRAQGPARPRDSLLDTARAQGTFASPATWRYHPRSEAPLLARVELSDGTLLYAGERGERWQFDKKSGSVRAAARLAPEPLIAILHLDDGGWLFVGQSGTGYESREPLGPFVRTSAPVDKLARVSAAGTSVVGITREGRLVQSPDAGATWKPVGPEGARFVDVMLADSKKGLALAVPEALFATKDGGQSWAKLDTPSMGALALGWDDQAGVAVQTAMKWSRWDAAAGTFPDLGRVPAKGRFKLAARPSRGPDAGALAEGRAVVLGGEYLEAARDEGTGSSSSWRAGGERWLLWRGPVGGLLKSSPLEAASGCQAVRIAGSGRHVYLACSRAGAGVNQSISIFRSDDSAKSFERDSYALEGRIGELTLAAGAGGALAVSGICPQHNTSRGCLPQGIHHRRVAIADAGAEGGASKADAAAKHADSGTGAKGKKDGGGDDREWELAPSATPSLKGSALAMAYSPDGRTLLAVGRRTKDTGLAVFVSKDGGESFQGRELEQVQGSFDEPPPAEDYWARPPPSPVTNIGSIGPAEDGTFALVLKSSGAPTVVVVDDEGRVISLSRAPGEANNVGAVGTRAVAFSDTSRMAWESLDGGATWDPIGRLPVSMCSPGAHGCSSTVRCHVGGCVIGNELSRIGWRGQSDDDQGVFTPGESGMGDVFDRKLRTPFACTLDEKPWAVLEDVAGPPTANQAAIGKVAWFALAQNPQKASASVYHAHGGPKPRVETVQLLAPATKPSDVAFAASAQVEGAAALRYSAPESGITSLKNVEVSWDNLVEGKVVRQRIADAGPAGVNDYSRTGFGAQRAQYNLLSIGSGGIYLRIHYSQGESQPTLFLDGRGTTSVPEVRWPGSSPYGSRTEMAHVGGAHVPVMMVGSGAALVRARRDGNGWAFDAFATGLAEPTRFGLTQVRDLAYAKGVAGLQVTIWDSEGTRGENLLFPFRAAGAVTDPPIALPTQIDSGDKPNRCGSAHKSDTPRVVVPYQGGTRHPIVVTDTTEPMRVLLTGQAVMHGTPKEPCTAAFDAEVVNIDPSMGTPEQERAIIVMDDLERSWIFRTTYGTMGEARVEYRVMSCRFDPSLEPPAEIFGHPGTRVRRAK